MLVARKNAQLIRRDEKSKFTMDGTRSHGSKSALIKEEVEHNSRGKICLYIKSPVHETAIDATEKHVELLVGSPHQ